MDFFETIKRRCSVRDYEDRNISKNDIEKIVDVARCAPSARGVEPWEFIVITESETLKNLAELAPNGSFLSKATAAIVIFCHDTKYYLEDGCAATENVLLGAAALGIGSCWVAGDKKDYADDVRKMLKVPENCRLISMIALGYFKNQSFCSKKRNLSEVIHWQRY